MTLGLLGPYDLAVVTVVAVAIVCVVIWLPKGRRVGVDVRKLHLAVENIGRDVKEVQATADQVNHAVNNVPPGDPTLVERIIAIETNLAMFADRLQSVGQTASQAKDEHSHTQAQVRELRNLVVEVIERKP